MLLAAAPDGRRLQNTTFRTGESLDCVLNYSLAIYVVPSLLHWQFRKLQGDVNGGWFKLCRAPEAAPFLLVK